MTPFEVRFLIAAGLLHGVGLPVAAAIAPTPETGRWLSARPAPTELSIDVTNSELSAVTPPREQIGAIGPGGSPREAPTGERSEHRPYVPGPLLTAERDAEQPPAEDNSFPTSPDADRANDLLSRPPSRSDVYGNPVPGLGDGIAYLPDSGDDRGATPAPTRTPERKFDPDSGTKAVQDKMREKDAKLGLDFPGRGPIRAAFVGAVYSSGAPDVCSAVFSLSVSPSGKVTDVSLGAFTGGDAQIWANVRKIVKSELSGVTLVMRGAFHKGANVSVMVKSERTSVSGGGSGWNGGTGANFDVTEIGTKDVRKVFAVINPQPID